MVCRCGRWQQESLSQNSSILVRNPVFSDCYIVIFREISTIDSNGPGVRDSLNISMRVEKSLFGAQIMRYGAQRKCGPAALWDLEMQRTFSLKRLSVRSALSEHGVG